MTKIILVLTLLLVGCSQKEEQQTTKAKISLGALAADFGGELYFVTKNVSTGRYLIKSLTATNAEVDLPNGQWHMMVYGWSESNYPFEGTLRCDLHENVKLDGKEISLVFSLTSENCRNTPVGSENTNFMQNDGQVKPLRIQPCSNLSTFLVDFDPIPNDFACSGNQAGEDRSFRIVMFESPLTDDTFRDRYRAVTSRCYNRASANSIDTAIKLPVGNDIAIPIVIESFTQDSCQGTQTSYIFKHAMAGASQNGFVQVSANTAFSTGANYITVFLDGPTPALSGTFVRGYNQNAITNNSNINFDLVFTKPIEQSTLRSTDIINEGTGVGTISIGSSNDNVTFPISINVSAEGTFNLRLATASVGTPTGEINVTGQASEQVTVDWVAPTATITPSGPLMVHNQALVWDVVFSEPIDVDSFTASDIGGIGAEFASWTILNASADQYFTLAAVPQGINPGQSQLLAPDIAAGNVLDKAGNPLPYTATGMQRTYFICPENYLLVNPNPTVGTNDPFCVMKYEAKVENGENHAISKPDSLPEVSISAQDAMDLCQNNGQGFDLISNAEWMTIAREIESNPNNYNGENLNIGHTDYSPGLCDATYDSVQSNCSTANSNPLKRRTHQLSSGQTIWDISGNAMEFVDWEVESPNSTVTSGPTSVQCGTSSWVEINSLIGVCLTNTQASPLDPTLDSAKGAGQILPSGAGIAKRGGQYQNGAIAGIYAIEFSSGDAHNSTGFRCVFRP